MRPRGNAAGVFFGPVALRAPGGQRGGATLCLRGVNPSHRSMPDNSLSANLPLTSYKVTICGLTELASLCDDNVTHLLSVLDVHHPVPQMFEQFPATRRELL